MKEWRDLGPSEIDRMIIRLRRQLAAIDKAGGTLDDVTIDVPLAAAQELLKVAPDQKRNKIEAMILRYARSRGAAN